jgi:hypothetical protein
VKAQGRLHGRRRRARPSATRPCPGPRRSDTGVWGVCTRLCLSARTGGMCVCVCVCARARVCVCARANASHPRPRATSASTGRPAHSSAAARTSSHASAPPAAAAAAAVAARRRHSASRWWRWCPPSAPPSDSAAPCKPGRAGGGFEDLGQDAANGEGVPIGAERRARRMMRCRQPMIAGRPVHPHSLAHPSSGPTPSLTQWYARSYTSSPMNPTPVSTQAQVLH